MTMPTSGWAPQQRKSCSDLYRRLLASIRTSTLLPVTFALGHTSLEDKVVALMFVIAMEYGFLKMHPVCKQVVSTTTDFGVEWGVAEFSSVNLRHLMPKWLISTSMEPDTEQDGDAVGPWQWDRLFENALRISGVLHIIDNATKQVNKCLHWWGSYYTWLKALESVLADKQRLRVYVFSCIKNSPFRHLERTFLESGFHKLYDKRWGEVSHFC